MSFLPSDKLKILPGVGHVPMADDPELITRLTLDVAAGKEAVSPSLVAGRRSRPS